MKYASRLVLLGYAFSLAGGVVNAAVPSYSLRDLGVMTDLPGRAEAQPNAISGTGKVAASTVSGGAYQAVVYDGQWLPLGTLGGAESLCADVTDQGVAVGTSINAGGLTRAFRWTPGGTDGVAGNPQMKDLGTLGGSNSEAYSINAWGEVAGYSQINLEDHAFVLTGGSMKDIGVLLEGGLIHSYGLSINDAAHVAGLAFSGNYSVMRAFFYDGTTAKDIGTLGGLTASGLAINNQDQIAGYSRTADGFEHAFRYANGTMTDLGTLGGDYSYAVAINDSGVVVGGSFTDAANAHYRAFIFLDGTMTDLNSHLDETGLGWILVEARGINSAGQIVGNGMFGGVKHAFLLTPSTYVPPPVITSLEIAEADVRIHFTTTAAASYVVEKRHHLVQDAWLDATAALPGTGSTISATVPGAAGMDHYFFRIRMSVP